MYYRVTCDFIVAANNKQEVKEHCLDDGDFVENHVLIEEDTEVGEDDVDIDLRKGG